MNHITFLRCAAPPIGDAGGSEILAVLKQEYVVIYEERTRRREGGIVRKFSDSAR
jgi:hypothetical protein